MPERASQPNRRLSVKTDRMRRRWIIRVGLLTLLVGAVGFVAIAMRAGDTGARQTRTESAFAHRVQPEATHAVAPSALHSARAVSFATDATAVALFAAMLWALFGTFLWVPAGSFVRPTRRRRAPPLLVA